MKYDLERLGPIGFQDLCAALSKRVFGATVRPMGRGRDGGRDMITTDPVRWSDTFEWTDTTVFQVKHTTLAQRPSAAGTFAGAVLSELGTWADPESDRGPVPQQLVFVTNVFLSAVAGTGGFDAVTKKMADWRASLSDDSAEDHLAGAAARTARAERAARRHRMAPLRHCKIIDGNDLTGYLDAYADVRRAVDGFLQAGDVLAALSSVTGVLTDAELGPALTGHARWALTNERRIYFDEAGGDTKGFPVEDVVIDLPVRTSAAEATGEKVVRYVLDRGDRLLRPSLASHPKPRHLVIVGAPGNGKTTVAKFLVHAYRAAWLGEDADLGEEHRKTVTATAAAVTRLGRPAPAHRRWPMRVDLAQFAVKKGTDPDFTLLSYMAQTLSAQTAAGRVTRAALTVWLKAWPSFLVLDGLDEVTEPLVRKHLIADLEAFIDEAESQDYDMLAVVTTRPTGYDDHLSASVFERVDLDDLELEDALRYGQMVTRIRVPDDASRRSGISRLLQRAAGEDSMRRLLRTPLQVLIMTIIAEGSREFAPSRYGLFWSYYTTIEQRERNKLGPFAGLIRDHSAQVADLHRRAGLALQQHAETADGADSVLSVEDLRDLAWLVLDEAGYKPSGEDLPLLDKLIAAATQRLVLLTPQPGGGLGFDVRSLQELMAAQAITTGTLADALARLRHLAASPHWRNTFLFAAGRFYSEPQPLQRQAVTDLVMTLDQEAPDRLGRIFPVGPQLASEMIDDGMAAEPKHLLALAAHALRALHHPEAHDDRTFTRTLLVAAARGPAARNLIADGLREALGGTRVPQQAAELVLHQINQLSDRMRLPLEVASLGAVKRDATRTSPLEPVADWDAFRETLLAGSEPATETALSELGRLLQLVSVGYTPGPVGWAEEVQIYLSDADVAGVAEAALGHVAVAEPLLIARLRHDVMAVLWRQPVAATELPQGRLI